MGEWMSARDLESSFSEPLLQFIGSLTAICEQMRDRKAMPILLNAKQARRAVQCLCHEFLHELSGKNQMDIEGLLRRRGYEETTRPPQPSKKYGRRKKKMA